MIQIDSCYVFSLMINTYFTLSQRYLQIKMKHSGGLGMGEIHVPVRGDI